MTSLRLPPVSRTASGVPCPSVSRWCFESALPRSTGVVRSPVMLASSIPADGWRRLWSPFLAHRCRASPAGHSARRPTTSRCELAASSSG